MTKHEEPDLRVVEVPGSLSARPHPRVGPSTRRRAAPTAAEVLEEIRSMKGAAALLERMPAIGGISTWGEVAFWGVCELKGTAALDLLFWDCDFPGQFDFGFASANCLVYFYGDDALGTPEGIVAPPRKADGEIWCYMDAPVNGLYLFVAHVETAVEPPDYTASLEFWMDNVSIGQRILSNGAGGPDFQYFFLQLDSGLHRFRIVQDHGFFSFFSVTAWHILVSHP